MNQASSSGSKPINPPGFETQVKQPALPQNSSVEDLIDKMIQLQQSMEARMQSMETRHDSSIKNLEIQMGQLAANLTNVNANGIPSNTVPNPRRDGNRECKAVTLRSGKEIGELQKSSNADEITPVNMERDDVNTHKSKGVVEEKLESEQNGKSEMLKKPTNTGIPRWVPTLPFPQRFQKKALDEQYKKFLGIFKQLHINIPFIEALEQMPQYAKFLKEMLSKKRRFGDYETVALTEECSAILLNKLPPKKRDPWSFSIPCMIGEKFQGGALCDLGSSVNLMPLSVFRKLQLGEAQPTSVTLQLADRSLAYPKGIIEDVLIKVDKFILPADFIVLDCEEDAELPLIVVRPFLATARTLIDVEKGEIKLRVNGDEVVFNMKKALKYPRDTTDCFRVDMLDEVIQETTDSCAIKEPFEAALLGVSELENEKVCECKKLLEATPPYTSSSRQFELLEMDSRPNSSLTPSVEQAPILELKPLPSHLEYAYLGESETLPIIISSSLTDDQKESLLKVLRDHKKALGWTIADIKGVSPSIVMHKILLEDDHKKSVQNQRRLNPMMKEVVKKEVIKWLDAEIIYPISDSSWVSPVQCVPKKGGMTVITNEQDELIPTRTVTGWRVCMDYRKLNEATRKDHFPLPFIDQMLDRLAGKEFFCFLDGYSGYNQIAVAPEDQEKTTFTCPYDTFAFRWMPFGLCNAPATFQRCMMSIFADMI